MRKRCNATSGTTRLLLGAAAALVLSHGGFAQPGEAGGGGAEEQIGGAIAAGDDGASAVDGLSPEDAAMLDEIDALYEDLAVDEAELPAGVQPLASYVVTDEITVRGLRPGDIRKRLWDIDVEIERTTIAFFRLLNDVIVDDQFHVHCVRPPRTRDAQGRLSTEPIIERRCYALYQAQAMRYGDSPGYLMEKEREYAALVMNAIAEVPSLAVAAENLVNMHEERQALTGGEEAMSGEQYRRYLDRREFMLPYEALERRRLRKAEREEAREARRQDERD